jgi:hypothetical protein
MKRSISLVAAIAVVVAFASWMQPVSYSQSGNKQQGKAAAQGQQQGQRGTTVGSFDSDGDGIPNCQDPDYTRPMDGTGRKLGKMQHGMSGGANSGACTGMGKGMGPRDGSGPRGGTGVCDGTGPKGKGAASK